MRYKIKSSLIQNSWFEKAIFETLDMYRRDEDLIDCPLNEFQRNWQTWGGKHESCIGAEDLEKCIQQRLKDFIELYENIKNNGYNQSSPPFFVYFDDDGYLNLYDGHHRISILRYLGLDPMVEIETTWQGIDIEQTKGRDFPLVEVACSIFGRDEMYQRVPDIRLAHFKAQREDSLPRLNYFIKNLVDKSVLDIGCSEGYFCHELSKRGYEATGIENGYKNDAERGRKLLAIARYLATIQNVRPDFQLADWKDLLKQTNKKWDNILYLSVLHNEINAIGAEQAFKNLRLFRGKTKRLFVEIPDIKAQKDWTPHFQIPKICAILERETGMKVEEVWQGYRPIILLTNQMEKISTQLKSTTMEEILQKNVNGCDMFLIKDDFPITAQIQNTGSWEPRTTQFIKDNLKRGQTFIDVGASVGYYTLLASKLVGGKGKVIAFEPFETNFNVLKKNVINNKLQNVSLEKKALGSTNGKVKLFKGKAPGQFSLKKDENDEFVMVEIAKYDKLIKMVPDMIKIDVEGVERDVLEGMHKILQTDKEMTIIIEDYSGETIEWLCENYGFKVITTEREYGNYMLVKNQKAVKAEREPMTFHLLGTFNTPTNKKEGIGYAFCSKIINIATMLKHLGHKVIFYGAEGSEVPCDEFIQVLNKGELPEKQYAEEINHPANIAFNKKTIEEISKRKSPYVHSRDILLVPTGRYQQQVVNEVKFPLVVEIGVGYSGVFSQNLIVESYAWLHWLAGHLKENDGRFTNAVIPPIFDPNDFEYSEKKDDYFLYLGRITQKKGVLIAKDVCKEIGAKLKIAGIQNELNIEPSENVELVGFADLEKRKELLSKAKAVFAPTIYLEPFGYVVIEAAMSGTPVITTDFGAFSENVLNNITGFRCRTFKDFIWAAKNIDRIKPKDCREWGEKYCLENAALKYQEYFEQLQNLYGKGWYSKI